MPPDETSTARPAIETSSFGSLEISFDDRLLRPRKWTTAHSYWAADLIGSAPEGAVLELCAGAGHIGLLAVATRQRHLVAVDQDPVACDYTTRNAAIAGLSSCIDVRKGTIEETIKPEERFAVVIADPPWVRRADTPRYPDDPPLAIDGGDDGLDIARRCVRAIGRHLLPGGSAVLQLGSGTQVDALADLFAESGLRVVETRSYDRGVLVRLDRT